MTQQILSKHVTVNDIMISYQLSRTTVVNAIHRGDLEAFKVGRAWRIPVSAVEKWIQGSSKREGQPAPSNETRGNA
jgi:excisionase family DNA binding protein